MPESFPDARIAAAAFARELQQVASGGLAKRSKSRDPFPDEFSQMRQVPRSPARRFA